MIEHRESRPNLMEELFESSVPDLVQVNLQEQKDAGRMIAKGRYDAPNYIELKLMPEFMTNKDGLLMVDPRDQRNVAERVLNGLRKSWNGSEYIENPISETVTEYYWGFVDVDYDFTPWTVVEIHNSAPIPHEVALSAYMLPGTRRPKAYQDLLDQKELELQIAEESEKTAESNINEDSLEPISRKKRAAKSFGKWLKTQTNLPPRPKRFE